MKKKKKLSNCTNDREKEENDVINILISENMENVALRCQM